CSFGIIDCDKVAREVSGVGSPCLNELVLEFSNSILNEDKSLNRKALGKIVFFNKACLTRLNEITHPYILKQVSIIIKELSTSFPIIVVDAPTLFESGADHLCDKVLSIIAKDEVTIPRIMKRDLVDEASARNRLNSQHDASFFIEHSDFIVQNDGEKQEFLDALSDIVKKIEECANGNSN
ncbi:MAG: dephospho-CoA kinase, partial [Oscillospiraceae bacterium]